MNPRPKASSIVFLLILLIVLIILSFFSYLLTKKNETKWQKQSALDYEFSYPANWHSFSQNLGKYAVIANFQTQTCLDDRNQPINVLRDNACIYISINEQLNDSEFLSQDKYLGRQFGFYDEKQKTYTRPDTVSLEKDGKSWKMILANNQKNYLLFDKGIVYQISLVPADSDYREVFEKIFLSFKARGD